MITKNYVSISISGDDFDPANLVSSVLPHPLFFETVIRKGDPADKGRYKGSSYPYGLIDIKTTYEQQEDYNKKALSLLDWVLSNIQILIEQKCEGVLLYITAFYEDQCNLEFSIDVIDRISEIGKKTKIDFSFSCIKET
ncbi:hypothetical protein [Leptospira yasudae]|uniref:DUF4279 domain-containing protein n=1 Tax=Leptospira yasudae TaxID=2202201 RepID=A0ABX9LZ23_9LEPT|nr:hypothetical protein [Leptospira yasudae]RHX77442.1 hypothetical protein DLM77_21135 [Leptospira yasudae]TGM06024.1 hypothetical protein EHQ86_09140 [Leptospira yasudae]